VSGGNGFLLHGGDLEVFAPFHGTLWHVWEAALPAIDTLHSYYSKVGVCWIICQWGWQRIVLYSSL